MGYGNFAPAFIAKSIMRFSEENEVDLAQMKVCCCGYYDDEINKKHKSVDLFLFNGEPPTGKYIEKSYEVDGERKNGISFESLFNVQDIGIN